MARFMISMPDEMLKKLDERARKEHRSRSELLREAARHHLNAESKAPTDQKLKGEANGKRKLARKRSSQSLKRRLLELGIGRSGCPGVEQLVGAVRDRVDMRRLLKIGKKLTGLSRDIIESREDRW